MDSSLILKAPLSLAFEYGMKNVYRKNFLDAFEEEKSNPDFGSLLERMGVVNRVTKEPELDAEMWEAACECASRKQSEWPF